MKKFFILLALATIIVSCSDLGREQYKHTITAKFTDNSGWFGRQKYTIVYTSEVLIPEWGSADVVGKKYYNVETVDGATYRSLYVGETRVNCFRRYYNSYTIKH